MHLKDLVTHFEIGIDCYDMNYCFGDIRVWSGKILLNFCLVSIFFDILIANISWKMAENLINHIIFWKSVIRTFRCIYVNTFNRLRFLAEISTKLQKMRFLGQITDHNSNDLIFSSTFSVLLVTFIFVFENVQNLFSCFPLFGALWPLKYLNFGQKLPIQTAHHTFLEYGHPEATKNPYYILSPERSEKKVSAYGLV